MVREVCDKTFLGSILLWDFGEIESVLAAVVLMSSLMSRLNIYYRFSCYVNIRSNSEL